VIYDAGGEMNEAGEKQSTKSEHSTLMW
jgi:hypothetical protein